MSYDIDTFKIKEINHLIIPIDSLYKHQRTEWHPERINNEDGAVTFEFIQEEIYLKGDVSDGLISVTEINCSGEGSGTAMDWVIEPALKDSKGRLVASCVWEGGDLINQLIVNDGDVQWHEIDI